MYALKELNLNCVVEVDISFFYPIFMSLYVNGENVFFYFLTYL